MLTALSSVPNQPVAIAPSPAAQVPIPSPKGDGLQPPAASDESLNLQLRELSSSNQELRSRMQDQAQDMQALKDELAKLKQDLTDSKAKAKPRRKPPTPQ